MKYYSDKTKKYYEEDQLDVLKADEEAGKKVCYPEDMIFLAENGFIK